MRFAIGLIVAVCCALAGLQTAAAEKRVALVIGNGAYQKVSQLPNPGRDATAVEALLRRAGFAVVEVRRDLTRVAMLGALRDFSEQVRDADIAVVFYAGHGMEMDGSNYLIPVDAALERDIDVKDEAVALERVAELIEPAKRLRLIILDACRDNPFTRSMRRSVGKRSIGRGLAQVEPTSDTLIGFAAKAGSTAEDGQGSNSPYTSALLKHLTTPGLDVQLALRRVRDEVLKSTNGKQEPFTYGSLGGAEIALVPGGAGGQPLAQMPPQSIVPAGAPVVSAAAREWQHLDKSSAVELNVFIERHGASAEAAYARARLKEVEEATRKAALTTPAPSARPQDRDSLADALAIRQLSRAEIAGLDCDALWYMRNTIYARNGYRFRSAKGRQAFGTGGTVDNPRLSTIEDYNVKAIQAVESGNGCPR